MVVENLYYTYIGVLCFDLDLISVMVYLTCLEHKFTYFLHLYQISMPGMMDTVLNLGLNDEVVAGLAAKSGERFAYDSYRRFLDMFGNVVSSSFIPYAPNCLPFAYFIFL